MPPRLEQSDPVYHRLASSTQTSGHAAVQERSGELWGRTDRSGHQPSVVAYIGRLPSGARGIEFTTPTPPDPGTPPFLARWTGPRPGVIVDDEYAKIHITVTVNAQR